MGNEAKKGVASVGERDANRIIEEQLDARVQILEDVSGADVLFYNGPIYPIASEWIKDALEALPDKRKSILFLLETEGGFAHVAERIALILRHHYKRVAFLVPSEAMSAGTILVMSGDSIYMDYASMLGPIDPQVKRGGRGGWVPALGYLEQYERFVKKSQEGELTSAELTYFVENFDPAELYQYEQETELSIALLEEWLAKYKFKNWRNTESKGTKVTVKIRKQRAEEIARRLSDTKRWHSHSRGIPMEVLRRDLKLLINDFGGDPDLGPAVQGYYHLLKDYCFKRDHMMMVLHTRERYLGF
jgi:hypothetical protein